MIDIQMEKECCGCGACLDICPSKAISFQEKTLGALFPVVDVEKCTECGLCTVVCPMKHENLSDTTKQTAFAAYNREKAIRRQSSSGGMFSTFAYELLQQGYRIYGAAFDGELKLRTVSTATKAGILPLCKSKYLQSDMRGVYRDIQKRLREEEKIFFVGTPCQAAALRCYLKKEYSNLIIADFFCHGVPSQRFFDECMRLEGEGRISEYNFRTKIDHGATPHYYTIKQEKFGKEKRLTKLYFYSKFYAAFQSYVNLRESCYGCRFAGRRRWSDITIGDFHEVEAYIKGIDRFDGVSLVVINTEMGAKLWENCFDSIVAHEMNLEKLVADGICFGTGTERVAYRDKFISDYYVMDFRNLMEKYFPLRKYWKQIIYYRCPKMLRKIMKRIGGI